MRSILRAHVDEGSYRSAVWMSVVSHLTVVLFFTLGLSLLPGLGPLDLGLGQGGGQGDFVSVGLAADLGGGAGMIKAPITPRPESAPVLEKKTETVAPEKPDDPNEFVQEKPKKEKPKPPAPSSRRPPEPKPEKTEPKSGLIPREADPGKGPGGGSSGSGGGFGTGRGVLIGSGTGEGTIDSWYIRQVEQRVGKNWLQTSLGSLERRVEAVATFVVQPSGEISDVELVQKSGVSSVDLAVVRAIRASHPLPPLPLELRGRPVRFRAVFEYPQQ